MTSDGPRGAESLLSRRHVGARPNEPTKRRQPTRATSRKRTRRSLHTNGSRGWLFVNQPCGASHPSPAPVGLALGSDGPVCSGPFRRGSRCAGRAKSTTRRQDRGSSHCSCRRIGGPGGTALRPRLRTHRQRHGPADRMDRAGRYRALTADALDAQFAASGQPTDLIARSVRVPEFLEEGDLQTGGGFQARVERVPRRLCRGGDQLCPGSHQF